MWTRSLEHSSEWNSSKRRKWTSCWKRKQQASTALVQPMNRHTALIKSDSPVGPYLHDIQNSTSHSYFHKSALDRRSKRALHEIREDVR